MTRKIFATTALLVFTNGSFDPAYAPATLGNGAR